MAFSPEIIDRVNKRLLDPFSDLPVRESEVGVLFGCRSATGTVADKMADLYHDGAFPKVMVAGGLRVFQPAVFLGLKKEQRAETGRLSDFFSFASEADYARSILLRRDVLERDIIIGSQEEKGHLIARELARKLEGHYASATVGSYAPYSRRNVGALRFQGLSIPLDVRAVRPFQLTPDNWHESKVGGFLVQEEKNMDPLNSDGYVGRFTIEVDLENESALRDTLPILVV